MREYTSRLSRCSLFSTRFAANIGKTKWVPCRAGARKFEYIGITELRNHRIPVAPSLPLPLHEAYHGFQGPFEPANTPCNPISGYYSLHLSPRRMPRAASNSNNYLLAREKCVLPMAIASHHLFSFLSIVCAVVRIIEKF